MKACHSVAANSYVIDRIHIHWGQMPVNLLFSYGRVDSFPFLIVRLYAGDTQGQGETPVVYTPAVDRILAALIGQDARRLDSLLPHADTEADRFLCEAISMALHDLVGQLSGLPLHALLGGCAQRQVPLMPCIFPVNADEAQAKAQSFFAKGFRKYLKTKLVGDFQEDLARVQAIRRCAPPGLMLQGDANCGYKTLADARYAADKLGEAGLDIFEDPLAGGVSDYRALKDACAGTTRIMVDKLSRRTSDLAAVLQNAAADVVGIHPVQPGSLSRARQHAQLAQSFGVPVIIGGTGYCAMGPAAYQHLTAVVTPGGPCGELGGVFDHGMPQSLIAASLPIRDGEVILGDQPGLGVRLNEETLRHFAHGEKTLG